MLHINIHRKNIFKKYKVWCFFFYKKRDGLEAIRTYHWYCARLWRWCLNCLLLVHRLLFAAVVESYSWGLGRKIPCALTGIGLPAESTHCIALKNYFIFIYLMLYSRGIYSTDLGTWILQRGTK